MGFKPKIGSVRRLQSPHRIIVCSTPQVLDLLETSPLASQKPRKVRAIRVLPDSERPRLRARARKLDAILGQVREPARVESIDIMPGSKLRLLPDLRRFENVERLRVGASGLRGWDRLPRTAGSVRHLGRWGHACDILDRFRGCSLDYLELVRCNHSCFGTSSQRVELAFCRDLAYFEACSVEVLQLESCNNPSFDYWSLEKLRGLRSLSLRNMKTLTSFAFVDVCKAIEEITVEAGRFSACDMSALERIERPLTLRLYGLSAETRAALEARNSFLRFLV